MSAPELLFLDQQDSVSRVGGGVALAVLLLVVAAILVALTRRRVRAYFGQDCPACGSPLARPVLSMRRRFGCLGCGSTFVDH